MKILNNCFCCHNHLCLSKKMDSTVFFYFEPTYTLLKTKGRPFHRQSLLWQLVLTWWHLNRHQQTWSPVVINLKIMIFLLFQPYHVLNDILRLKWWKKWWKNDFDNDDKDDNDEEYCHWQWLLNMTMMPNVIEILMTFEWCFDRYH